MWYFNFQTEVVPVEMHAPFQKSTRVIQLLCNVFVLSATYNYRLFFCFALLFLVLEIHEIPGLFLANLSKSFLKMIN